MKSYAHHHADTPLIVFGVAAVMLAAFGVFIGKVMLYGGAAG